MVLGFCLAIRWLRSELSSKAMPRIYGLLRAHKRTTSWSHVGYKRGRPPLARQPHKSVSPGSACRPRRLLDDDSVVVVDNADTQSFTI